MILALLGALLLLGVCVLFYFVKRTPIDNHDLSRTVLQEINKTYKDDGLSLAVGVYKGGRSEQWFFGHLDEQRAKKIDSTTFFEIGSITKVFSSLLLQRLVEEGVVAYESTLAELLGSHFELSPQASRVTLAQLASHTSGLPRVPKVFLDQLEQKVGKANILEDPYSHFTVDEMFDYLRETPGIKPPGEFSYSNYGMGMMVHSLEHVTGLAYKELLSKYVLDPLELRNTKLNLTDEDAAGLVQGYSAKRVAVPRWNPKVLDGAGALYSTPDDLMKFVVANLEGQSPIQTTLSKLHNAKTVDGHRIGWMSPMFLDKLAGNHSIVWHNGATGGYASYISVDVQAGTGVVVLSNCSIPPDMLGTMLTRKVRTQSWRDGG